MRARAHNTSQHGCLRNEVVFEGMDEHIHIYIYTQTCPLYSHGVPRVIGEPVAVFSTLSLSQPQGRAVEAYAPRNPRSVIDK